MDYKKGSNKTMTLGLQKLKASKKKYGTIFLNPGASPFFLQHGTSLI